MPNPHAPPVAAHNRPGSRIYQASWIYRPRAHVNGGIDDATFRVARRRKHCPSFSCSCSCSRFVRRCRDRQSRDCLCRTCRTCISFDLSCLVLSCLVLSCVLSCLLQGLVARNTRDRLVLGRVICTRPCADAAAASGSSRSKRCGQLCHSWACKDVQLDAHHECGHISQERREVARPLARGPFRVVASFLSGCRVHGEVAQDEVSHRRSTDPVQQIPNPVLPVP